MDKARILPPLVRGKVMGVLSFFVAEIKLFRNILLTDNLDLVLQVQWWGEGLPAHIRPKKLQVQDRCKNLQLLESHYHSANYEIRTTLDLFRLYLKVCERVELSILEATKDYLIGSAFLTNVISLLNKNDEYITLPIIDYIGEIIGEVTIQVTFWEKSQQKYEQSQFTNSAESKDSYLNIKFNKQVDKVTNKIKSDHFTTAGKIHFYNSHSKENYQNRKSNRQLESLMERPDKKKNHITNSSKSFSNISNTLFSCQEINMNHISDTEGTEFSCKHLPEITKSNDSSKVLHFGCTLQQLRLKDDIKSNNKKVINKFNTNSIQCKSKAKDTGKLSSFSSLKKSEICKTFSTNTKNEKEGDIKESSFEKFKELETFPCYKKTDIQSIPSKELSNFKVLNYLLGSDMSKYDEETALRDFKKMSPSHNLVDSISQLCLVSDKSTHTSENTLYAELPVSLKPSYLNFDLNNPIERNYYEKFFLQSHFSADFEVAEFLNQPESKVVSEKRKFYETKSPKTSFQSNSINEFSHSKNSIREEKVGENNSVNEIALGKNSHNCVRCKYYKKLDELDTVIDSLKHFEQKMRIHNEDLYSGLKHSDPIIKSKQGKYY